MAGTERSTDDYGDLWDHGIGNGVHQFGPGLVARSMRRRIRSIPSWSATGHLHRLGDRTELGGRGAHPHARVGLGYERRPPQAAPDPAMLGTGGATARAVGHGGETSTNRRGGTAGTIVGTKSSRKS